jgi:hypothetical protein
MRFVVECTHLPKFVPSGEVLEGVVCCKGEVPNSEISPAHSFDTIETNGGANGEFKTTSFYSYTGHVRKGG